MLEFVYLQTFHGHLMSKASALKQGNLLGSFIGSSTTMQIWSQCSKCTQHIFDLILSMHNRCGILTCIKNVAFGEDIICSKKNTQLY